MGMPWLQKRMYQCRGCLRFFLHDQMHPHVSFGCPSRKIGRRIAPRNGDRQAVPVPAWVELGRIKADKRPYLNPCCPH